MSHFSLQYEIFHRDAIHLYFCLFEDVTDCCILIRSEHALNDLPQSDSSIHKRSTALERSVKYFTGGLKLVLKRQPHTEFRCGSRHIDFWFAWKTPNLSMHHLLEHINQDIKRRNSKDKDSTVNKTEYQSKKIQQVNPSGPDQQSNHQSPTISSIEPS